jgi:uncharacterized protein YacL
MVLWILRAVFILVAAGASVSLLRTHPDDINPVLFVPVVAAVVTGVIVLDVVVRRKRIDLISSVYFGLVIGLFLTFVIGLVLEPIFQTSITGGTVNEAQFATTRLVVMTFTGLVVCYACISLLWQTKDDFRFVIPYVEFAKEVKGLKPYVLDTSVIIDGRIADLVETGVLDNQLIMPRFVLSELQAVADSNDKMRRARGRRGLDVLSRLRGNTKTELKIYERELPDMNGQPVDMKLVLLARHLQGKIVTGDYNLNKIARLQNVPVINLNEIANALKPVFLPGEQIEVKVVKAGEEAGQGIGYLVDGTMVVIEDGRPAIGQDVRLTVTSMLQTNAGRMVFGKLDRTRS